MPDTPPLLSNLAPWPQIEFTEFGEVELRPQPKLAQLAASFIGRNWVAIPHVTHHDEADITEFEEQRAAWNAAHPDRKLTLVPALGKLVAEGLAEFPQFNASLSADCKTLILKRYFHVGYAIDTPRGLLVGVIRDCDSKSAPEIAADLAALSGKAREKGLSLQEMSGGCMTISSLGHIGGTMFTPIVNAPEVAILGVTRTQVRPAPGPDGGVAWRKMLPLSMSYDHRVINGADAARFMRFLADRLADADVFGK